MACGVRRDRIVSIMTTSERGGAEYANVDLLNALAARGHDVVLLTNLPELAIGTDVPVRRIDLGPKLALHSTTEVVLEAPLTALRLARAFNAERPVRATMAHFKKEQLLCSLLPRRLTGEIVWLEWGPVPAPLRRGLPAALYTLAARRARRILAVSEGTRRTVIEAGVPAAKVLALPDLVSVHSVAYDAGGRAELRRSWGVGEQTLVVGCVSRLQRRKRNDLVIDAMAQLTDNVLLVLAGEGEEEAELRERARPYGERVRFLPSVRGHVQEFLSACDVLVFAPSPTEADRPRIIAMAQLIGLPVLATHPEGAESVISSGAGAIATPHHDPGSLAALIAAYRDDPERRAREGEIARRVGLQRHDPEPTLRAVEEALGTRPSRGR
jgi:glycosyltransferase involved in cell wall biosynthesis